MNEKIHDFAVIGAGIAGASLAAMLAEHASVICLEAEDTPGYHATGRSAAFWDECYGGPGVVPLTLASGAFLREKGFMHRRGALHIGRECDRAALDQFMTDFGDCGVGIERIGSDVIRSKVPGLRSDWMDAVWEEACSDIDVAGLHGFYLSKLRSHGGEIVTRARITKVDNRGGYWTLGSAAGERFKARCIINAAGAWADQIAQLAGSSPIGITPFKRTVIQLRTDPRPLPEMPLILDISGKFYFKPENGRLWLSPHDEDPSTPCDAAPDELAVAEAIDRFQQVVDWSVEAVETKWAGLRSFAPDRLPVYGFDPAIADFYWFAGQGGFGIQTAPAAAAIAAAQLLGVQREAAFTHIDAEAYSPARFG